MIDSAQRRARGWEGLGFSLLLALAYMLACLGWMFREAEILFTNDGVTAALSIEKGLGAALEIPLVKFGLALFFLHSLLGLLAFALARLVETAFHGTLIARRSWLIAGWFVALAGLAMAANTTSYPASIFAGDESAWRNDVLGLYPVQWLAGALLAGIAGLIIRASPMLELVRPARGFVALVLLTAIGAALMPSRLLGHSAPAPETEKPHIVLIGIDSLRNDLTVPRRGEARTPNIRAFIDGARRFNDATTPIARTYGSWVSVLTGRHPVTTNARVNLMPRRLVHEGETLADALRAQGYRAIYASDEVRFANFDRSYGFDALVTPPVGAIDFLLGYAGDLPLVNLAVATNLGGLLFPSNHANRAAAVTYRPRQFTERLENELEMEGPTFLAIHLTLAHWPYSWAGVPRPSTPDAYRDTYGMAVSEVDRQFGDLMRALAAKRVLDNAIVVLLSDHGEALGADNDSMLRGTGTSRQVWDSLWGHGTSVLSPNQYHVLLALRAFGRARLPGPDRNYDWPVSLEDLRPTLEDYVRGTPPNGVDGISLLPFMADPSRADALASRVRFTETDFNTPSTLAGRYEESGVVDEAAVYYELDRSSGWVQFRESRLADLLARKERAALSSRSLLAAIPGLTGGPPTYLYSDRYQPRPRPVTGPPDPIKEPEARRLWEALVARFPGELPDDPDMPRM